MKVLLKVFVLSLCSLIMLLFPGGLSAQEKKVLFVIVDGIPADVLEKLPTPRLDAIAAEGGYARAYVGGEKDGYSQSPTISAVGYNSLITGTWTNKHNVWGNGIEEPNYHYHNIFRFAEELDPVKKTAVFSTWLDNRTKLIGEGLPEAGNILLDAHFDGYELDTTRFPHGNDRLFIHKIDEHVVDEAVNYIKTESPDLSWVYLEYSDDMGHRYGDSKQFYESVKIVDEQMGRLWEAISYREENFRGEDWEIYITTDHGRDAATGKGHGGQSDRERQTWIVTNAAGLNNYFREQEPGIVDILPSMLRSLELPVPRDQLFELDGIPITGKISVTSPGARLENGKLQVSWKPAEKKGKVTIWLSTTNNFYTGGKDQYRPVAKVPLKAGEAEIDLSGMPSSFYKVVIQGKHNAVNRWVKLP
ncbi:type I phosphodiesterase/nucleotide pyrophosphatase [Anseongella ginsenosidimutans]|uniref:Type I phosphodiesterase/nucleotide pyrophosphatase n=1 Tax=Anseongella ginsenosidimutans TaxID=496056 RepID=A0A4R3KYA6_9SPHI|nr:alkaline phosphatase family protein [Anseongella ginsenosidimutans]QEC51638.1 alkaline phosphatase family protein [Anseongella ginsenosidimutans]TCS88972.1 type I phosphodiesterase/nucleotide pyrophosphatase [Anseongella ginsenosidimutans]